MEHIRSAFDNIAAEYDAQRQYVIPQMDQYYGAAFWAAESKEVNPAILDIGAGTGLLAALMLEKFPAAELTLLDISENMLAVARERFAAKKNVRYVVNDYSRSELGGTYDIICSALSIHHLDTEDKRLLFHKIYAALAPGGMFVNADQADGETLYFRQQYLEYWNEFLQSGPLKETEYTEILKRRNSLDKNEKLSLQLSWLHECGFSDVDLVYKNRTFIVTVAKKG